MDFEKIKKAVKEIRLETLRLDSDNKLEAVAIKAEINKVIVLFDVFFGPPTFPSKNKLSPEISKSIDEFGGIMPGQTLYYWSKDDDVVFAMLWPWNNGQYTTIKLLKKKV